MLCVRWYCRYQFSYRDLEEMMRERGLTLDHTTILPTRPETSGTRNVKQPHDLISVTRGIL